MRRLVFFFVAILFVFFSCEKEEDGNPRPSNLTATDGTAVGCIHINFEMDPNVSSVILERREKGTENWQVITGTGLTSFDENQGYPNTGMPPGKVFEYRIKNDWPDDAPYSEIDEGYAYDIIPVTEIEISSSLQWNDETLNLLTWNEHNNGSFINQSEILFDVYRSEDSLGTYTKVATVDEDRSCTDILPISMKGQKVYYRIDVYYSFELNLSTGGNHWENTTPVTGTIVGVKGGDGNQTIDYNTTSLGQIFAATQDGVPTLREKTANGTVYLGAINNAGATGYGTPTLYSLNGTSWENEWTTDPNNEFNAIHYAVTSGNSYVAGIDDSLCVYEWDGASWSANLTPDNLGQADGPSNIDMESLNDEIYLAIKQHPDYDLQVLKYSAANWDSIGGDVDGVIASGDIVEPKLENINGVLYLYYRIGDALYIKHLNGASWVDDLTWSHADMSGAGVDIASDGTDLYFIVESTGASYLGGVYKVTSSTNASEIISNDTEEWFQFPLAISVDSEGNLIVVSMNVESAETFYPFINVYDGTEWKTVSGNFSDGMDPADLTTIGTDIYYIYGDASSENTIGDPTVIRAKKMTK